jgi:hypothetical protein
MILFFKLQHFIEAAKHMYDINLSTIFRTTVNLNIILLKFLNKQNKNHLIVIELKSGRFIFWKFKESIEV